MRKSADILKETIKEFLSGFSNLEKIKKQLIDATSIMVTAVPHNTDKKQVRDNFLKTS